MEAVRSSETSVNYLTLRRHIPRRKDLTFSEQLICLLLIQRAEPTGDLSGKDSPFRKKPTTQFIATMYISLLTQQVAACRCIQEIPGLGLGMKTGYPV
jgi:hypothetical protein